ncbi:SusC/RagA family TonB-linked outer membrane protein [Compostibacter hankyongensis]|uniref:SusC/RagA family TonB-linked outer membrane protein n=1 Tax=Compostibacter hankyongensis TaxID=1007089 RepID=A0ABP8FCX1_9BACT
MKNRYILIGFLLAVAVPAIAYRAAAQQQKLHITMAVKDEEGRPVADAEVFSGDARARTDANGKFTISADPSDKIVVDAPGFGTYSAPAETFETGGALTLKKEDGLYGEKAKLPAAFREVAKGDLVGAITTIDARKIGKYDHTIWARDVLGGGRLLGMLGADRIRGIGRGIDIEDLTGTGTGTVVYLVDGLPRDITTLRLSEIESITVLRDVNSAVLYGSDAVNGIVSIKTKRGEAFKKESNFSLNYGISAPRELPRYLNSADYMTYFNRARQNDGLSDQFSEETIAHYRDGNRYRYPDVDYYSDEYLRSVKNYFDLNGEFSGGNDQARYYADLGWNSAGSLLNFGEGAKARNNKFNVRGNVDLKVNDWIKTAVNVAGFFVDNKGPRGDYWSDAAEIRPYEYTPLLPIALISPGDQLLLGRKNDVGGTYLLGGNSNHTETPFGDGYSGGVNERVERTFSFNNQIDVDLEKLTKGLSFHTNISFDYYARYDQAVENQYSVYEPVWSEDQDSIIALKQYGKDSRPGTQSIANTYFERRFGAYGLFSYDRTFGGVHHLTGSLLGYLNNYKQQGDFQGLKQAHAGLQLGYVYNKKYMVDFSGAYVNSVKLAEGHRGGFSPTIGLGWLISSENFMSSAKNIDYLKLKLSAGMLKTDFLINGFFYYDNRYGTSGSYNWYEGGRSRSGVKPSWGDNPNLNFSRRNEINLGVDGSFFNHLLSAEVNVFYDVYDKLVTRPGTEYPGFYTDFIPYENFGANAYKGAEVGLGLHRTSENWSIDAGINLLYTDSKRTKVDEIYNDAYQYRKGRPADANFGLKAIGLFADQADIDNSPVQSFGAVKPGDIKYKDQNGDGVIDDNDQVYLGRYQAPFSGGLQVRVGYKSLTLYVLGEGSSGSVGFRSSDYYWVDGNKKYSEVVLGSWTPETKNTATYPRLSSQTNDNNFRTSSYWMYSDTYFQIRRIQVTYAMPRAVRSALLMENLDLFVDATNIWQFSGNRKIRNLTDKAEPNYRTFSIGLNASF